MLEVGYSGSKFIRLSGWNFGIYCIWRLLRVTSERASQRQVVGRYPILQGNTNSNEISGSHTSLECPPLALFPKSPQEKTTEQKSDDAASASIVRTSELKKETFLRLK